MFGFGVGGDEHVPFGLFFVAFEYHLITEEFSQLARSRLENGGVVVYNVVGAYGGEFDESLAPERFQGLAEKLLADGFLKLPPLPKRLTQFPAVMAQPPAGPVYTDNYAPVGIAPGRRVGRPAFETQCPAALPCGRFG